MNINLKNNLVKFYKELEAECLRCGRNPDEIKILFASKYLNSEQLASFIALYNQLRGQKVIIGENRVQEAEEKFQYLQKERPDLGGKYYRIMIGNLQKNKINRALVIFDEIWGVDSPLLAQEIDNRATSKPVPIFLEVNISGEAGKHGVTPDRLDGVIRSVGKCRKLKLKGLMTMAPETEDREKIRKIFRELRQAADKYHLLTSMGMSGDWREAVEAGSKILRIGSGIFVNPET